jgi:hypothetical protein
MRFVSLWLFKIVPILYIYYILVNIESLALLLLLSVYIIA